MHLQKLIILRGYPGSGKTTVGKALESHGAGKFIDHNAILTFVAGIVGNDDGVYDQIADLELAMCRKMLKEKHTVIVARGFSKVISIRPYVEVAENLGVNTKVIRLDVSEQELSKRVTSPERKLDFNPTINKNELLSWINENRIEDLEGEVIISNERPLEAVVAAVEAS